ncbi:MAG TPA: NAD(P)-dependent oxidoreductase [Pseudonocardiaceae bacterium]|jgi:3-hydroxyisobutyrate dehydrogenase|nr:NAD(P)-dependent oxidoreductase [Pseudonocardiaceae bacterium]
MATTSVTVLGTGLMGAGMARSLARAGHDVTVWNRTPDKARLLAGQDGIKVVENLHEALGGADFILTMLFDADAVTEVMRDALPDAPRHTVWVQTSTVGISGATRLAELADEHDVAFVDAPVLGTRKPAEQGKLIVLAAGDAALRDRVAPVFDAIGSRTIWVGEQAGDGHRLKLVANSWVLSVTGATAQSIGFAQRLGVDPQLFLDAIAGGPLDCGYAQVKAKAMLEGDFTPSFGLAGAAKDSELILSGMRDTGTDDRLMRALRDTFTDVRERGHGEDDMAAVVLAFTR